MIPSQENVQSALLALLLAASVVLWSKRRQIGALLQMVGWALLVFAEIVHRLTNYALETDREAMFSAMRSRVVNVSATSAILAALALVVVGYVWHAIGEKRI